MVILRRKLENWNSRILHAPKEIGSGVSGLGSFCFQFGESEGVLRRRFHRHGGLRLRRNQQNIKKWRPNTYRENNQSNRRHAETWVNLERSLWHSYLYASLGAAKFGSSSFTHPITQKWRSCMSFFPIELESERACFRNHSQKTNVYTCQVVPENNNDIQQ